MFPTMSLFYFLSNGIFLYDLINVFESHLDILKFILVLVFLNFFKFSVSFHICALEKTAVALQV